MIFDYSLDCVHFIDCVQAESLDCVHYLDCVLIDEKKCTQSRVYTVEIVYTVETTPDFTIELILEQLNSHRYLPMPTEARARSLCLF